MKRFDQEGHIWNDLVEDENGPLCFFDEVSQELASVTADRDEWKRRYEALRITSGQLNDAFQKLKNAFQKLKNDWIWESLRANAMAELKNKALAALMTIDFSTSMDSGVQAEHESLIAELEKTK